MRAVTFQAPGEVRVDDKPEPQLIAADDVIVRVAASGVCGSYLHIYHGRVAIEPGFTIGHEYVGSDVDPVLAALAEGSLDPSPLVTRRMKLDDAEAYEIYDRREALKVVLTP